MAGKTLDVKTLISKDCCIEGDITLYAGWEEKSSD